MRTVGRAGNREGETACHREDKGHKLREHLGWSLSLMNQNLFKCSSHSAFGPLSCSFVFIYFIYLIFFSFPLMRSSSSAENQNENKEYEVLG